MLNQVIILGRIIDIVEQQKNNNYIIKLVATRVYKNEHGEYEKDIIPVVISKQFYDNLQGLCKIGDLVGVRGKLETIEHHLVIIGEKITFLSHNQEKEENNEEEQ